MLPLQLGGVDLYVTMLINAGITVALFVVAFAVLYLVGKSVAVGAVDRALRQRGFEDTLVGLATSVTTAIVAVVALALAATIAGFGVVLSAFAILGGAIALAVGFAAQDLISNFVAGVFIVQEEPFVAGDWIEWDGNGGVVRAVHLRVTELDTFDNQRVTVPNSALAGTAVVNNVKNERRRVSVGFGISYDDDIEQARDVIVEEAAAVEGALSDPAPAAPVSELGDSAVVLSGRLWIDPAEHGYGGVRAAFVEAVKERFDAEGIDMPYPNRELSGDIVVADA